LESFITAAEFSDRKLGSSEILTLPTAVMDLISGNNFTPKGDLFRRIITCRLDAKTDAPERRSFSFNPLDYIERHRQEMVAAALTLLRGFVLAGKPRDSAATDRLGSFEQWDDLIRQCVMWLGREGVASDLLQDEDGNVADPAACIDRAKQNDPE